jgi:hypothetical protein
MPSRRLGVAMITMVGVWIMDLSLHSENLHIVGFGKIVGL